MRGLKSLMLTSAVTALAAGLYSAAFAEPQGGSVTGGSATITQLGPNTTINQTSDRAVVRWNSFDLLSNESVKFKQPGSSSIILNRITDTKPSSIDGKIEANGQVMLLNQNGIMFGSNARVDVTGLVASTGQVDDAAFMAGQSKLKLNSPNEAAAIINYGTLTAKDAGLIGLVAPQVENNGVIEGRLGKVALAGAERVTLDLAGDDLVSIDVTDTIDGAVRNNGIIRADGGSVYLTASRARGLVDHSIVNTGQIHANTVGEVNGRIKLSGPAGRIVNSGLVSARGDDAGEKGGEIDVLGDDIRLTPTSRIDASGRKGGGTVHIGGDYQGAGNRQKAKKVKAEAGSETLANAIDEGDGGQIVYWAEDEMRFHGTIEAEGGFASGDGGDVEVSGKKFLDFTGLVSTTAENGETGNLLLDPTDIEISTAPSQNTTGTTTVAPSADNVVSILNSSVLQTALASSNVTVQTRATGAQPGNITVNAPLSWTSTRTLTLTAANDIIVNQAITGRALTFNAGHDVQLNAALAPNLSANGTLRFNPTNNASTVSIGDNSGTFNLDAAELANITGVWAGIDIGTSTGTGAMTVQANNWASPLTLRTMSGAMTIAGNQTMASGKGLVIETNNLNLNGTLSGNNSLAIQTATNTATMGLGTGATGDLNLDDTEMSNILNGFSSITMGRSTSTAAMDVRALTWNDPLTLRTQTGQISINGAQNMGANNLTLTTRNLNIGANVTGTGSLLVQPDAAGVTMGMAGGAGTLNIDNAELSRFLNWTTMTFGLTSNTAAMDIGAFTWPTSANVNLYNGTGLMTIAGAQSFGAAKNLLIQSSNLALNGGLSGTGALTVYSPSTAVTMGLGNGATGTLNLDSSELAQITNGWTSLTMGRSDSTAAMDIRAATWLDPVTFTTRTGAMTVNGAQNFNNNTATFTTRSLDVLAGLSGTGTLIIQPEGTGTTMGLAGGAGTLNLTSAELANIMNGWNLVNFGSTAGGAVIVNAATWNDNTQIRNTTGNIVINGAQDFGSNNATFQTNSDIAFNAAVTGTGNLSIVPLTSTTTIGVAGGAGTVNLATADLDNITDGWNLISIGSTAATSAMAVNARNWNDNLLLQSSSGVITIAGAQNMGANNLTLRTSGNPVINAALAGTGTLTIDTQAVNTTIGLGGGTGTMNLTAAEIAQITNGWNDIIIGRADGTGAMTVNALTWNDPLTLQTLSGAITIAGAQTMGANNLTLRTNSLALNAGVNGSSILRITPQTASTTIGLAGGAGTLNLTATEMNNITNGWDEVIFGRADGTGLTTVNARSWNDDVTFLSNTGGLTFAGAQTFNGNTLNVNTNSGLTVSAAMNGGGGQAVIAPLDIAGTVGVGGGAGNLNLTAAEAAFFTGWNQITVGRSDGTAGLNIGTSTWADPVHFLTAGNINLTGNLVSSEASAGTNFVLASTAGNFLNSGTINPNTGRYLVYSQDPDDDIYGSILRTTKRYNRTYAGYAPGSVTETGNVFLYAIAPTLNLTIDNATREYGDANPAFSYTVNSGLIDGDLAASAISSASYNTLANNFSNVGSYNVSGTFLSDMGYQVNLTDGTLAVTKAMLTATSDNQTREYGDANPALTVSYTGFKNGETSAVIDTAAGAATGANNFSNVGNYAITASGATDDNYDFTYTNGNLAVTKAMLTATADNQTREYGDANPALTVSYTGFKNSETSAVIDTAANGATGANNFSNVGNYVITASGAADDNYDFTYADGSLSVTKAILTARADNKTRLYGDANPPLTISYIGFKNGETYAVLDTAASASTLAKSLSPFGNYVISASGGLDTNYDFAYVDGVLSITAVPGVAGPSLGGLPSTVEDSLQRPGASASEYNSILFRNLGIDRPDFVTVAYAEDLVYSAGAGPFVQIDESLLHDPEEMVIVK